MPRDDWAKARAKDKARNSRGRRSVGRSRKRKQDRISQNRLQSPSTVLWFGVHKGKTLSTVAEIEPSYIQWLSGLTPDKTAWRLKHLVKYLRTSPRLANRRMARHMGGDEAPATTNMACESRQTEPHSSRAAHTPVTPGRAVGELDFPTPLDVLARDIA